MNHEYSKYYEIYRLRYVKLKGGCKKWSILSIDFDNTISKITLPSEIYRIQNDMNPLKFKKTINKIIKKYGIEAVISQPFLDNYFINYLRKIKKENNVKIIITSYGIKKGINEILQLLDIGDIFDYILTPQDFNLKDGYDHFNALDGKNKMILKIQNKYNVPKDKIILVDDSLRNIESANNAGYMISFVKDRNGMIKQNVKDIMKFVKGI